MVVSVWSDEKLQKETLTQHKAVLQITLNNYFNTLSEYFKPDI